MSVPATIPSRMGMPETARRAARLASLDFRHGFGVWIVLALVAAGCWYYLYVNQRDVVLWGYQSVQLSWSFAVIGPIGAGWGAWLAGRDRRARTGALMASTSVSGFGRDARTLVVPVVGALGAYIAIALLVLVQTAMDATWGGPVWSVILYGGSVIVGYTVVGTVAGILVPARLTPFLVAIGLFLFTIISYTALDSNSDYRHLAPFRWVDNADPYDQLLYTARGELPLSFLAAFGLVFGATIVVLALLALARHGRRSGVLLGVMAAVILAPSLNAAVLRDGLPFRFVAPADSSDTGVVENPPLVCGGEVIETCVHQAFERQLDEVANHVDTIVAPVAGLPGVPVRLEQRADLPSTVDVARFTGTWETGGQQYIVEQAVADAMFPSPVWLNAQGNDSEYDRTPAQTAIAQWLVRQAGGGGYMPHEIVGYEPPYFRERASEVEMTAWQEELAAAQANIAVSAERFAALPPEEQRAWLEANWDALRAGELTLEDLP